MKKETTTKSKLWIWIVAAAVLLLAVGGAALAFLLPGGNQGDAPATTDPIPTGPRADLYWNLDREFYTANSQTGLSTREADADGKFKMKFAYNGEIVELEIIDKKLVNIIDTQDIVGLQFDENGVVIGQINVRDLATEVGKKVYVKKATDDMIIANSSMAMNGMELNLKLGQYSEIYDLREGSETYGQKIAPSALGVMDCMTVYANAEGDNTHFFILQAATRSKIYWRANLWVSSTVNRGGLDPDENGVWTLPFYCEGELVQVKTKDVELVDYYAELGKHSGFTGLIFDDEGYAIDIINAAVGAAGQQTFFALDIEEINGTHVKLKAYWSTSGVQAWEGDIPAETPIYNVSSWAYSEGVMGQKLTVADLKVGDRLTMFSDMEGNPIEIGLTLRTVDLKPMFNNSSKYDAATRSTTRVKGEDGYWEYTFINEKGISKYKTKDQKLANFIDSYPERVFGIVTKGDKLVKAYEYDCIYAQVRFSTALYVDSINGTIISCTDQKKANAYTAVLSEDYKVLDISGDSKQWGQKIKLQVGDCMISFRNRNKEVCMIYVTKRTQGGKLYVNTTPNTSRAMVTVNKETGEALEEKDYYWEYEMTDINGKKVVLQLPVGKKDANGAYANKYLQSRIDSASQGIIALEVSGTKIKDAHAVANMASGNSVGSVFITKAGTTEFEYKTTAKPNDETSIYPGWTGSEGVKYINLSGDYKSHKGEKLSGGMKVNDVYYMVRNRANETVAMFLISRGFHNDLFFLKQNYPVVNGVTTRPTDADGYYVFSVMYAGKPATVRTKDAAMATQLEGYRTGAALKLDKANKNTVLAANDFKGTNDAYTSLVSNWDVSKISGTKVKLTLNIPTTSTTVGDTKEVDIKGAKIYNISPDAGEDFGKITKLQKNDRVRIFTDKNGKVSYVLVTVRGGVKTAECAHCGKTVTWNPLAPSSGMGTGSAHYYVFSDWTVTGQQSVSGANTNEYDVVIDLNGKTVFNPANTARTFMVAYPGKSLTLMDTVGTGHVKSYGYAGNAGLIQVSYGASLTILGGTYELLPLEDGMKATRQGGVIFSYNDATYPDNRNTVTIKGGTIIGNEIIHQNRATDPGMASVYAYGGALYAQMTDVIMTGGTIKNGLADRGGNVYLGATATFTMTGGEIIDGQAKNRGGNIFAATGSKITIDGGKVLNGTVLENLVEWEENGEPKSKKTGQQGGNIVGHNITVLSGEISGGHANTTGGNFFLLSSGNKLSIYGGKIAGGTAVSGGGNVYVYGGEGLVEVYGGEIDASGITMGKDTSVGSVLAVYGGKVGAASIAADCGAVIGGSAQIEKLTLNKSAKDMGIQELTADAKVVVDASDKFAKAYEGFEALDIAAYIGNQIVPFNTETTTITCETIDNVKYLVATVATTPEPEPDEPDQPVTPGTPSGIPEAAIKMTTDGVFNAGGIITADCPACGTANATWMPLTADMQHLKDEEHTHFYLPGNVERATNSQRYYVEEGTVCIHLNGFTYDQKATSACEGAIKVSAGSTLNIMGNGKVIGAGGYYADSSWPMGGALDVRGTANIYGGTYMSDRNRPSVAPFASSGATINMYGGKIAPSSSAETNATGFWGSIVMNQASQVFNLYGGEIVGAEGATAGDLRVNNGTFNVYGGYVGRVYANKNAKVNVNNGANIGELDIKAGATVTLADDLAEGTEVYITDGAGEGAGLTVANAKAAEYANKYILAADETKVLMANADNQLYVVAKQTLVDTLNTTLATATTNVEAVCPVCVKNATWVPLTPEMGALDAGTDFHYYLAGDITRTDNGRFRTTIDGTTVCIHLNGKTYNQGSSGNIQGAIQAKAGTTINILDVADNSGTVIGAGLKYDVKQDSQNPDYQYAGGAIDVRGTVNIYGGTFMSSNAERPAVAMFGAVSGKPAVVNMYGGKITRDEAVVTTTASAFSSLVRMYHATHEFNMYGGELVNGMANRGGNVRMQNGTFNMYGGTIKNGTAANLGGNINIAAGTFNLFGGQIQGGTCASSGGSIGLVSGALNIEGGEISGATGVTGGLVYVYGGNLNITGGELKNGTGAGGNVYLAGGTNSITGGTFVGGKISAAEDADVRAITVGGGKALTLGKATIDSKVYVSGTVTVQNGTVATVELVSNGKVVLANGVTTGTEITVIADATRTITTIDNAADYLAYFKTNVAGATIGVKADTTNEIEIVVPVAE